MTLRTSMRAKRLREWLAEWRSARRDRRYLRTLDERGLRDIGLDRAARDSRLDRGTVRTDGHRDLRNR